MKDNTYWSILDSLLHLLALILLTFDSGQSNHLSGQVEAAIDGMLSFQFDQTQNIALYCINSVLATVHAASVIIFLA